MEELFDLLEDGEEGERVVMEIPQRGTFLLPGMAGGREHLDAAQERRQGSGAVRAEERREETRPLQSEETARKGDRPGDVAELILETVGAGMAQEGKISVMPDAEGRVWGVAYRETSGAAEETPVMLQEWSDELQKDAAERRWYEAVGARGSGAEQLYLGINAPRLRGTEWGARNVVVHLNESEQRAPGTAAMDARALDRVFQRDARRYDGGLSAL